VQNPELRVTDLTRNEVSLVIVRFRILFILLLPLLTIRAQITYVDINPDSTACCFTGWYSPVVTDWDLDNDGTYDFSMWNYYNISNGNWGMHIDALSSNSIVGDNYTCNWTCKSPYALEPGDTICTQGSWIGGSCFFSGWLGNGPGSSCGYWPTGDYWDYFIGFKFFAGSTLYNGWMKLDVHIFFDQSYVKLKEYAYGTSCITVNEGNVFSVEETSKEIMQSHVYPNPISSSGKISISNSMKEQFFRAFSVSGELIAERQYSSGEEILIQSKDYAQGLYLYILLSEEGTLSTGKFIIAK
jgi:hypothetical protein